MRTGFFTKLIKSIVFALLFAAAFGIVLVCSLRWLQGRFGQLEERETMGGIAGTETGQTGEMQLQFLPDVALQIVFVTAEDGTLCGCFYTELDCIEQFLTFYVVPIDTRLQLSTGLYHELSMKNAKLAQINTLEALFRSFSLSEAPGCVVKALDEAFGVSADYYTVMPKDCYDMVMKEKAHSYEYDEFLQEDL